MSKEFKIYTKRGDKGETSLLGGARVPKYHKKIEAYGTVDELTSFIGLIRCQNINPHYKDVLIKIQERLFIAGSHLAADKPENTANLPGISDEDISFLENEIDKMNKELPELKKFILPGGHSTISYCHIARAICRRSERLTIKLSKKYKIEKTIVKYLNRLSDYLFVLARKLSKDLSVEETLWKP